MADSFKDTLNDESTRLSDIHTEGWGDGYDDKQPNNTYPPGSKEYAAYEEGYAQGSADC